MIFGDFTATDRNDGKGQFVFTQRFLRIGLLLSILLYGACNSRQNESLNIQNLDPKQEAYNSSLRAGLQSIEVVRQFDQTFANAKSFISYYDSSRGSQIWNSEAGIYQRYILTLQIQIRIGRSPTDILVLAQPTVSFQEIQDVIHNPTGSYQITYGKTRILSAQEWSRIYESNGDLNVVGVQLDKHSPIVDFDKALSVPSK